MQEIEHFKIQFGFTFFFFIIYPSHVGKGFLTDSPQHCRQTSTPQAACSATERTFGQISRTLSTRSIENSKPRKSSIQAPLISFWEIFHMLRLYRKAFLVNRKVCFQQRKKKARVGGVGGRIACQTNLNSVVLMQAEERRGHSGGGVPQQPPVDKTECVKALT